mgnify:CR=1 FL=1
MMKNPHPAKRRVMILLGVFGAFLLLFGAVLYDAQILHGSENRARSISSNATSEVVPASRGIITDRNGKVLVSNRLAYTLVFDRSGFTDDASLNDAILRLIRLCQETGTAWNDTLPIAQTGSFLRYTNDRSESFTQYLEKNKLTATAAGRQLIAEMRALYHVDESLSEKDARLVIGVRYELHSRDSYTFAEDVSSEVLSLITDGRYEGVSIRTASARVYNTTLAAHILGTIGPIWQEEWSSNEKTGYVGYADKGYSMNDLVGKDGVEKAFEEYLRGTDGRRLITTDEDGKLTGHNTDGVGFVRNLHEHGIEVKGKRLVVLGAGGAATAICVQAALDGAAEIAIFNRGQGDFFPNGQRTVEKLRQAVPACRASITPLEDKDALARAVADCDILVNATRVGMKPLDGETLVDPALFRADLVVADTVYNPRETRMIREAKATGCQAAVGGIGMLLWQGVAAFKLFTGKDMPAQEVLEKFFS